MKITQCPISGSKNAIDYLDLGDIPLVNNLCATREESLHCEKYPLVVQLFVESGLSCLTETVPKEELFSHYVYKSGVNKPYLEHCSEMYDYIDRFVNLENGGVIVDIGGNDGSLLKEFKKKNDSLVYINVDPCDLFEAENLADGIEYFKEFFNEKISIVPTPNVITTTNVFQHNKDIRSFVKGIYRNLAKDGIWCLEFPYWLSTIITDNYDQVYHEHIYYYRLKNIVDLLAQEGLKVIEVSYFKMHAGTMRIIATKNESQFNTGQSVCSFLNLESFMTTDYYKEWGVHIKKKIKSFKHIIEALTLECNETIFGFGAAAKGCVFLNTCELTWHEIPYVIDDTPEKQGKFIPGTGIEIVSRDILKKLKPDYILILAHNFKDYIMASLHDEYNGKFIVMFPDISII